MKHLYIILLILPLIGFGQDSYVTYHENGKVHVQGQLVSGKEDGLWKYYDENGQLKKEGYWTNGKHDGVWKEYYGNGNLFIIQNLKNGKKEGLITYYDIDGKIKQESEWRNDKKNGFFKFYYSNGELKEHQNWKDDVQNGFYKTYYSNGQLHEHLNYLNGKREGEFMIYDSGGNKTIEGEYKNDISVFIRYFYSNNRIKQEQSLNSNNEKHGPQRWWYENGQLELEMFYTNGVIDGVSTSYYLGGKREYQYVVKNGKLISTKCWNEDGQKIDCE